jgi:hypothetical protein
MPVLDGVMGESTSVADSPSESDFAGPSSSRNEILSSRRKVCMSRLKFWASVVIGGNWYRGATVSSPAVEGNPNSTASSNF